MSTLEHKGYDGSVDYSSEDHILHGKILGIRDSVSYEGEDVRTLEQNFMAAVDEYLAFCEAEGKQPEKPFKGTFNVRVKPRLHKLAALRAIEENKKLNNVVEEALEEYLHA